MRTLVTRLGLGMAGVLLAAGLWLTAPFGRELRGADEASKAAAYRSPLAVAVAPDGKTLYVSDRTAGCVEVLDLEKNEKRAEIPLAGEVRGLALSADGGTLYVAERQAGDVAVINAKGAAVASRIAVGPWPVAVTLWEKGQRLYACNRGDHTVSVVDLAQGKEIKRIPVVRDPAFAAVTPDGARLVVANLLPHGVGTDPTLSAEISILDTAAMTQTATVKLPPGSTMVTGLCVSPDGKWAYVVHALGRFNLPVTQLERGWVHTYALSLIDLTQATRPVTVLLDDLTGGAADPYAIVGSGDGKKLWISHGGIHEISLVDIGRVHELLAGKVPPDLAALKDGTRDNVWVRIAADPKVIAELTDDLTALYIAGAIRRVPSAGSGPRGLALSPDGKKLFVANYFSGSVAVLDADTGKTLAGVSLGPQPAPDAARRGEIYFNDARRCFQRWHSCASCHPDDGRVDGLPWDFIRDGIGNPKDVISLVYMPETSPHNRRATRPNPRECIRTGVEGSHMLVPEPADVDDVLTYVASLKPEPNPNLARDPKLVEAAQRGKAIFEGKAQCATCHPAPYYTDKKMHDVGCLTPNEPDGEYDTPTLVEAYRTAPYLHDGRALTLKEVLTTYDPKGAHGTVKGLSAQEIDDLVAYLLSL
ncbi:MAG: beta-propeller fold lactonase family protein [Pirellulales bacterium]